MCGLHHIFRVLIGSSLLLTLGLPTASSAQTGLQQKMDMLSAATSLDRDGIHPWHMRLSFDLYGLDGKPQESGTIEEWWVSTDRARVVITSPSFNQVLPGGDRALHSREAYLVHELLREVVHPMLRRNADQYVAAVAPRSFGQTSLSCTNLNLKNADNTLPDQFCTDPATGALRLIFSENVRSDALNDISSAMDTQVAMMHTIAYLGHPAIKGHIESIEPFDPSHSDLQLGPIRPPRDEPHTAPRILTRITPIYPRAARDSNQSGLAVLHTRILPNGKLGPIDTVASTGSIFTEAATDAVSRWAYTPYKRNGVPSECDAAIAVTFLPPGKTGGNLLVLLSEDDND